MSKMQVDRHRNIAVYCGIADGGIAVSRKIGMPIPISVCPSLYRYAHPYIGMPIAMKLDGYNMYITS